MKHGFYDAIKQRRSIYALKKESPVSDEKIEEIVAYALKHTPTAFNSQSGRVIILLDQGHDQLWDLTKNTLKEIVPEDSFDQTAQKIDSFKNGYGTVLFFEDQAVVEGLQDQFALYKDNFPIWSQQASGMLQNNIWTAFAVEGLGASLQHYNEVIEDQVKEKWQVPEKWKLVAQMPFGAVAQEADEKAFESLEQRVKVYSA